MLPSSLNWKIHHVGVAVHDIEKGRTFYSQLSYRCGERVHDPLQHVYLAFCEGKDSAVELVAPVDDSSPCVPHLTKVGPGPYHTCYSCTSIDASLQMMKQEGMRYFVVAEPKPTRLFAGRRVMFLQIPAAGLIELIEGVD